MRLGVVSPPPEESCGINPFCLLARGVGSVHDTINSRDAVLDWIARTIGDWAAGTITDLATFWVGQRTPDPSGDTAGGSPEAPPMGGTGLGDLATVLGYVQWVGLAVCVLALILAGAKVGLGFRSVEEAEPYTRVGNVLAGVILISGASALIAALMRGGRTVAANSTVAFLQDRVWWYAMALAVVGVIIAGVKMAWDQRADAGKDLVRGLLRLIVVTGLGVPTLAILVSAADAFAVWIVGDATDCKTDDAGCFEKSLSTAFAVTGRASQALPPGVSAGANSANVLGFVVLWAVAAVLTLIQIVLLIARTGILVVLVGLLPVAAAATNTEFGETWFKRSLGWLIAWLLYKPVAAIIYATAFHLTGNGDLDSDIPMVSMLTGIMLMLTAIMALRALQELVAPGVQGIDAGGSDRMAAMVPAAAVGATNLMSRGALAATGGPAAAAAGGAGKGPAGGDPSGATSDGGPSSGKPPGDGPAAPKPGGDGGTGSGSGQDPTQGQGSSARGGATNGQGDLRSELATKKPVASRPVPETPSADGARQIGRGSDGGGRDR